MIEMMIDQITLDLKILGLLAMSAALIGAVLLVLLPGRERPRH